MARRYNLKNIRTLLIEGFYYEELIGFTRSTPEFRAVYDQLAKDTGKVEFIDQIIEFAERQLLIEYLLVWIKQKNPNKYKQYAHHLVLSNDEIDTAPFVSQNYDNNVAPTVRRYNFENIRTLLEKFTREELRIFCYDEFRPVYEQLSLNFTKEEIVGRLIDYAYRTLQIDELLKWAEENSPGWYLKCVPYYDLITTPTQYNFVNIRNLLAEGFTKQELRRFCLDEFDFRPVYYQLSSATTKQEIIQLLIEYSSRTFRVNHLLDWAKEQNPARYKFHEPYYHTVTEETLQRVNFHNPYIAGPPITQPEMFFGRQTDLEKVIGLLKNNFVMLTGPRRIGKTSLLHQLAYQLSILIGPEKFIPVLVNIEGTLETEFFHLLMEEIVSAVQPFLPPETTTTLSFDLSNLVYPARAFSRDLQTILKGLQTTTPLPSRLVLLLDEMDTLNSYSLETQSQLRRIFQRFTNTNLSIVVAGVKLRQQWAGESSPFYNMFIPVTLSPFPETEARRLITEPVQGRYIYQDEAITRILQATSGLPHRIQQLCLEVINRVAATTEGRQEITMEDVDSILPTIQWLDEPTLAPDQVTAIVTAQPAIAEDRTEYDPTTSTSTDQEAK